MQLKLIGATMGAPEDFVQMLNLVSRCQVQPVVDSVYPLEEVNQALRKMADSSQFGKLVLALP